MQKRILLVVPRLNIGGAESYVAAVAEGLQRRGCRVHVASGGGCLAEALQSRGIAHHYVPVRLHAGLAACLLRRIARRHGIDLIHANSAAAGVAAVKVKDALGIPVLYTAHGSIGHNAAEMTLNRCDRIVCVSEFLRRDALAKGFAAKKLTVVYTGIDCDRFRPDGERRRRTREALGIADGAFAVALVARIKNLRDKGHDDMLRVLREYPAARRWHLLVIGKGRSLGELRRRIRGDGLTGRVHCLGRQTEVAAYLDGADAVVLPSRFETFGLVLAEGMAMEKPAAAYAVGGTPEVIDDGRTGFLAPPGDTAALGAHLAVLAGDPARRAALGRAARRRVEERFSYPAMLDRLIDLYERCLTERNEGRRE